MYEISIQREFCAAHAITIAGQREPVHGHNWRVTLVIAGDSLDEDGLVCDFHALEHALDQVLVEFDNCDLNRTPPFDRINPTAEHVARIIAERVEEAMHGPARVARVSVTESPGCMATYFVT